jgi:uncharacterized membrane protein
VFFSDGVFAIAITLLVLEIRLPEPMPASHASDLSIALLEDLWPDFYSFWFVGALWIAHHRVFRLIKDYDRGLLLFNLFILMWIVLPAVPGRLDRKNGPNCALPLAYCVRL